MGKTNATKSEKMKRKELGQYNTTAKSLQDYVFDRTKNLGHEMLEPSFGAGHLLLKYKLYNPDYPIVCYEIDDTIETIIDFNHAQTVHYGDFTKIHDRGKKYMTIVGNPPYVARPKTYNLYIEFIKISFGLLADGGEMIFIVPSDFIKLTSASSLIDDMVCSGAFTDILFPGDETLFDGASVDVMVFRYEKGNALVGSKILKNGIEMFCNVHNGIMTFSDVLEEIGKPLSALFDVYVGIVSGKDEVFRHDFGNLEVLCDEGVRDKFLFLTNYPPTSLDHEDPKGLEEYFESHKASLMQRKIKHFSEDNWFEWGAPRNMSVMYQHAKTPCIYIRNMTRKQNVAFVGVVEFFGGALLCLIPKSCDTDLYQIVDFLNGESFRKNYTYAKRFKIGQKQTLNVIIPDF